MGEIVIPPEVLTPALMDELRRVYAAEGLDFERYVVGGPMGPDGDSLNPVTGLREFFDSAEDSVADNEAAWDGLDDDLGGGNVDSLGDGDEGGRAEPATTPREAPPGQAPGMEPGDLGPGLTGEYYGPPDPDGEGSRTAATDGTPDPASSGGATPPGQALGQAPGQALGMTPGDLGPGLSGENFGRTAAGQQPGAQPDPAAPADPARTGPAQNALAPGATPAGAVDINQPGKLNTIQQSNLAAEIAGGLKASYGRAWADSLLGQLDRETARQAGVPDAGPTRENAALLEEAEKLQKDLGPGASLGAISAVNRGLTPGTGAFSEHARKENAMWAARDKLSVIESQIANARERLNTKIAAHEKAKTDVNKALGRSRGGDRRAIDVARARAKSTLVEVREEAAKLGELGRTREGLREDLNGPAPTYEEVSKPGSAWVIQSVEKNLFHGVEKTEKYVHPDGREFVFDRQTKELVADERRGTYNFTNANVSPMGHLRGDIIPALPDLAKRSPEIVRDIVDSLQSEDDSYRQ